METNIEALASKYGLTVDFVNELHEKVIDKENFARAVRMFAVGLLPYDMATGKDPSMLPNIGTRSPKIMWNFRRKKADNIKAAMEQQRKIVEYYNECKAFTLKNKAVKDVVFGQGRAFGRLCPF